MSCKQFNEKLHGMLAKAKSHSIFTTLLPIIYMVVSRPTQESAVKRQFDSRGKSDSSEGEMISGYNEAKDIRILLVEDKYESLQLIRNMLGSLGFNQIFTARNGKQAIDMFNAFDEEEFVDIILCDWNMPRLTGLDLLKQIRSCDPDIPFMMITGKGDASSIKEARSFGVSAYIKKPFSQDQLAKKMNVLERVFASRKRVGVGPSL